MILYRINIFLIIIFISMFSFLEKSNAKYEKLIYDFKIESINQTKIDFSNYKNRAILLVNVASKCGFTKQYEDLQNLWEKYGDKKLIIIGLPSNQFGQQEPGTNKDIKEFCETNFNITFPMTIKIDVKGDNIEPIYSWAKKNYGKGAIPKWNFHKILIDTSGKIFNTYSSFTKPLSKKIINDINNFLK